MSDLEINKLLSTMRTLAAQAGAAPVQEEQTRGVEFSELLKASIDKVNDTQQSAGKMAARFETGDPEVDVTEVMVALQKADISFRAMTEVRNRLVTAYQEIMNMPV